MSCNIPLKKNNSVLLSKSTILKQKALTIDQYKTKRQVNSPQMTSFHKKLYPFIASTYKAIEHIKRKKSKYDTLKQYQNSFINEITGKYHNESITKLNKTFFELRQKCDVKHRIDKEYDNDITHRSFIKSIEDKEEKIIRNINELNKGTESIYLKVMERYLM